MTQFLTTKEAAEYLRVQKTTIDRWCDEGRLSFYKITKNRLFKPEDLDALVESGRVEAVA